MSAAEKAVAKVKAAEKAIARAKKLAIAAQKAAATADRALKNEALKFAKQPRIRDCCFGRSDALCYAVKWRYQVDPKETNPQKWLSETPIDLFLIYVRYLRPSQIVNPVPEIWERKAKEVAEDEAKIVDICSAYVMALIREGERELASLLWNEVGEHLKSRSHKRPRHGPPGPVERENYKYNGSPGAQVYTSNPTQSLTTAASFIPTDPPILNATDRQRPLFTSLLLPPISARPAYSK